MIHLNNIQINYPKKTSVLQHVNLQIPRGHITGLLGLNGAGKTTLLKVIAGMLAPTAGELHVLQHYPRQRRVEFLQQLYFVPDAFTLPSNLTGKAFVSRFANFYPLFDHELFKQIAEMFQIDLRLKLGTVSYGQSKKFIVAFGFATRVPLLLMDEPLNGLDIPSKSAFRDVLIDQLTPDRSILISTHEVRELPALLDSVCFFRNRRVEWADLGELGASLSQTTTKEIPPNAIYSEPLRGGHVSLVPADDPYESELDLELLFNAYQSKPMGLMSAVNMQVPK